MNDTLKINRRQVAMKLREISVEELHRDLAKSGIEGILDHNKNIIIGETSLQLLLQEKMPELKKATTKHLEMCGCFNCIVTNNVHRSMKLFRKNKLKRLEEKANMEKSRLNQLEQVNNSSSYIQRNLYDNQKILSSKAR